jgi:hypothetical protein
MVFAHLSNTFFVIDIILNMRSNYVWYLVANRSGILSWINRPRLYIIVFYVYQLRTTLSSPRILLARDIDVSPRIAVGILLGILLMGIFVVGYDQGHLFSLVQGQQAFDTMWMHEFYHDMRHAAGFPCH